MTDAREERLGAEYVFDALEDAGVDLLVGLPGTQTLPLDRIVAERDLTYVMARHETAIPHVAWGHYESGGSPAATITVPGPGDANAMHGLRNALEDGVPIVHLSPDVDPAHRGQRPIHEIDPHTFDNVVKANVLVEDARELGPALARGIETALAPPYGPVRIGIPSSMLGEEVWTPRSAAEPERIERENGPAIDRAADVLAAATRPVVYAGKEARRSRGVAVVDALAEALSAPVLTSLKGKGVFPEDDPRFAGVTGGYLPAGGRAVLGGADVVLALGTDFNGPTTDDWQLPMGDRLIHVTERGFNPAYEPDVAIHGDVSATGEAILDCLDDRERTDGWDGSRIGRAVRAEYEDRLDDAGLLDPSKAYTPGIYRELRERLPRETVVTTGIGGHRLWATQAFEAYDPDAYVTAGSWAGMGVGLPSAIGARVANPDRPVVCLIGDGGLMMCIHELHTAAEHDLDVVVVVMNDADYGIISQLAEYGDRPFRWTSPDFTTIAEGFGARGTQVASAEEAADAVEAAIGRDGGPELIDVVLERDDRSVYDLVGEETDVDLSR